MYPYIKVAKNPMQSSCIQKFLTVTHKKKKSQHILFHLFENK